MPTPIGLTGLSGSGKDTVFGFIHEWADERGILARRRSFADALKLSFARMFIPDCSVDEAVIWCNEIKFSGTLRLSWNNEGLDNQGTITTIEHRISGRTALQRYGTEGHRDVFDDNFWVDVLFPLTRISMDDGNLTEFQYQLNFRGPMDMGLPEICVAADTRFSNEARRIKDDLGGYVLEIVRPNNGTHLTPDEWKHASESGFDRSLISHEIRNDGSLEDLRDLTREWCNDMLGKTYPPATTFDT